MGLLRFCCQMGAQPGHIQLKVKDQQGSEVQFKIKKSTPLRKLMDAYCSRLGLQASQVRFMGAGVMLIGNVEREGSHVPRESREASEACEGCDRGSRARGPPHRGNMLVTQPRRGGRR